MGTLKVLISSFLSCCKILVNLSVTLTPGTALQYPEAWERTCIHYLPGLHNNIQFQTNDLEFYLITKPIT